MWRLVRATKMRAVQPSLPRGLRGGTSAANEGFTVPV